MQKVKIGLGVLVVGILAVSMTTVAVGSTIPAANGKIIPVADAAKLHAAAPDSSPVISTNEDGDWILTLLPNAVESGAAALDVLLGADCEFPGVFSTDLIQQQVGLGLHVMALPDSLSFAATPEPSTMVLLALGGLLLRRRKR